MAKQRTSDSHGNGLVDFMLPGLLHGLGNAVFSIQGFAQLLGTQQGDGERERTAILEASDKARAALVVFHQISGEAPVDAPGVPAGQALRRLGEFLAVPLRDSGLRLQIADPSSDEAVSVDGTALSCAVVEVLRHAAGGVPSGFEGSVQLAVTTAPGGGVTVVITIAASASRLPFPVDLGRVADSACDCLRDHGVAVVGPIEGSTLRLAIPPA